MTEKEFVKGMFFKDLCARLPYGLKCQIRYTFHSEDDDGEDIEIEAIRDDTLISILYGGKIFITDHCREQLDIEHIKPYLRPLDSMTKEEGAQYAEFLTEYEGGVREGAIPEFMDFVYSHHLDIGHLIDQGLALEAPKEMYE